jgi:uncharacterized protein (TIGR00255 family)
MKMKSMTGFGYAEFQDEDRQISLELKSYNNRYLDIHVNLPSSLTMLEPRFREYLAARVERGKVELGVRYRKLQDNLSFSVDVKSIANYVEVLHEIQVAAGVEDNINLSHILEIEDLVKARRDVDPEAMWSASEPLLDKVFSDFDTARTIEGKFTMESIMSNLSVIREAAEMFRAKSGELESGIRDGLMERFEQVLGNRIDEDRVLAETAVLLVKFSIEEEISRLFGHLDVFVQTSGQDGTVGKKLDFLCQELNRELNTVGSKSTLYEINHKVVDAKDALENIREQLRNVE